MDTEDGWFSDEQATFGDRVAGARDAAGLTQDQLAEKLGVKPSTVRDWEDDVSEPRSNKLQMMAGDQFMVDGGSGKVNVVPTKAH